MLAIFQSAGSSLEVSDVWKFLLSGSAMIAVVSFNSLGCRLSGPGDLLVSNFCKRLRTSVCNRLMLSIGDNTMYSGEEGKGPSGSVVKTKTNCWFSGFASLLTSVISSPSSVTSVLMPRLLWSWLKIYLQNFFGFVLASSASLDSKLVYKSRVKFLSTIFCHCR